MQKSTVYVSMRDENLDCSYAIVEKEGKSIIIILRDLECIIYDYNDFQLDNFDYKYLLLKYYEDSSLAYKDFLKLIGKMCKKSIDSKYFNNHIEEDNVIIFYDDKKENMIPKERENEYLERKEKLTNFIRNSKNKIGIN